MPADPYPEPCCFGPQGHSVGAGPQLRDNVGSTGNSRRKTPGSSSNASTHRCNCHEPLAIIRLTAGIVRLANGGDTLVDVGSAAVALLGGGAVASWRFSPMAWRGVLPRAKARPELPRTGRQDRSAACGRNQRRSQPPITLITRIRSAHLYFFIRGIRAIRCFYVLSYSGLTHPSVRMLARRTRYGGFAAAKGLMVCCPLPSVLGLPFFLGALRVPRSGRGQASARE